MSLPSTSSRLAELAYRAAINPTFTAEKSQAAADRAATAHTAAQS